MGKVQNWPTRLLVRLSHLHYGFQSWFQQPAIDQASAAKDMGSVPFRVSLRACFATIGCSTGRAELDQLGYGHAGRRGDGPYPCMGLYH